MVLKFDGFCDLFCFLCFYWMINSDKWCLQCSRCCPSFYCDLPDESLLLFWSNFGRLSSPGKVNHCCMFSPVIMALTVVYNSIKPLKCGFYTFQKDVNDFVFYLFLNSFARGMLHFRCLTYFLLSERFN